MAKRGTCVLPKAQAQRKAEKSACSLLGEQSGIVSPCPGMGFYSNSIPGLSIPAPKPPNLGAAVEKQNPLT